MKDPVVGSPVGWGGEEKPAEELIGSESEKKV